MVEDVGRRFVMACCPPGHCVYSKGRRKYGWAENSNSSSASWPIGSHKHLPFLLPLPLSLSLPLGYASKLILRPNRAYSCTLSSFSSSRMPDRVSSSLDTSSPICSVDSDSFSRASGSGSQTKESPTLYLPMRSAGRGSP